MYERYFIHFMRRDFTANMISSIFFPFYLKSDIISCILLDSREKISSRSQNEDT